MQFELKATTGEYIRGVKQLLAFCLFLAALLGVLYAVSRLTPIVGDYFSFFRPTTVAFVRGDTNLYDATSIGFFNAPWALALWIPFIGFPYAVGQAAHELVYILSFIVSEGYSRNMCRGLAYFSRLLTSPRSSSSLRQASILSRYLEWPWLMLRLAAVMRNFWRLLSLSWQPNLRMWF